jgi:hypothetical protein
MDFKSRDGVKLWVYMKHIGQRNLTPYQTGLIVLKIEPMIKAKAKERQKGGQGGVLLSQISAEAKIETAKELEKLSGISHDTISKVRKIEKEATPEQKRRLSTGEAKVNAIYREIRPKEVKPAIPKLAKLEAEGKEDIKKEVPNTGTSENSLPISLRHIQLLVNNFLADADRYLFMPDYTCKLTKEEKDAMLKEIEQVKEWYEKFKIILKN